MDHVLMDNYRGFYMKMLIIKMLVPLIMDVLVDVLKGLASKTDNDVDDHVAESIERNKNIIAEAIKQI